MRYGGERGNRPQRLLVLLLTEMPLHTSALTYCYVAHIGHIKLGDK